MLIRPAKKDGQKFAYNTKLNETYPDNDVFDYRLYSFHDFVSPVKREINYK